MRRLDVPAFTGAFVHTLRDTGVGWQITLITPDEGVFAVDASSVVMATGCRERSDRQVLLHGERPAGIFTAGQAQRLINIDGVMPGREVVILGSGDIGLIMARRFTLEGARVRGVYEIQPAASGLARNVAQCLEDWEIPLHLGTTVTDVHGRDRVEAVTVCPVDGAGGPDRSQARDVRCDTLVISVGLIPENDILVDLGMTLDERTGGPAINQRRESEMPGLFVCGNAVAVYDLVDYVSECGRAAGRAAARHALDRPARGAPGGGNPQGDVPVTPGHGISGLIPQRLDPAVDAPPVLFFRVRRPVDRAVLRILRGELEMERRQLRYLRPPEMVRYQLGAEAWWAIRGSTDGVTVTVEAVDGT